MHRSFVAIGVLSFLGAVAGIAWLVGTNKPLPPPAIQAPAAGHATGAAAPRPRSRPTWDELTPAQQEALSPLAADWDGYDGTRKKKWLEIAKRYQNLSPEGQQKMHERMPDLAKLTPEQRTRARENLKHAYSLPPEERRAKTQGFQDLTEEQKRQLAEKAAHQPPPARRPTPAPAVASAAPARAAAASAPTSASAPAPTPTQVSGQVPTATAAQ